MKLKNVYYNTTDIEQAKFIFQKCNVSVGEVINYCSVEMQHQ